MNKLWTFGCSYTEGYVESSQTFQEYKKYCGGEFPKTWPNILAEKLNLTLINKGEGASGNHQIFQEFCKNSNEFSQKDIIIIGWTFLERYRIALDDQTWLKLGPGKVNQNIPISEDCHESLVVNRTLKPYVDEIYNYEKLIDRFCESLSINVYYWTIINELIYNQPNDILNNRKYLINDLIKDQYDNVFTVSNKFGGYNIFEETNGLIQDYHQGKTGHEVQANLFYDHIVEYNRKWTSL
jgi:hypothetical protein